MSIASYFAETVAARGALAAPIAFVGGVISGLNPCCFPLYPAAAATCCATRASGAREPATLLVRHSLPRSAAFVAGIAMATTMLGILAAWVGRTLAGFGGWVAALIGLVPVLVGLHFLGIIRLPLPRPVTQKGATGVIGAFVTGLLFALVLAPCGTPVLAAVLSYAALTGNVAAGGLLLFAYGLGTGLPVLAVGTVASSLAARLDGSGLRRWVDRITGVALIAMGVFVAVH